MSSPRMITRLALATAAFAGPAALGQPIMEVDFEAGTTRGWRVNGLENIVAGGGNPGDGIGVPRQDWYWITLSNEDSSQPVVGDLTVHPTLRVSVDIAVFHLSNWFQEPMDPGLFPLTLELVDEQEGSQPVSVYITGAGMPAVSAGWTRYTFDIPETSSTALPAGWGGTGDEDPVTFMPRLPANRTYTDVLRNVDQIRLTTARPGYSYIPSFWQVSFDNIVVEIPGGQTCVADMDDGSGTGTPDGGVTIDDLLYYLGAFDAGDTRADVDNGSGTGTPDGGVTIDDLLYFLVRFDAGC